MLPLYDNIRRRRIELGMSQQELAEKLGYTSRTTIAKIEAGKIDIPNSKVVEFGKALKIHPGQLMGWTEEKNKSLWRYTTIENDKIAIKIPGLKDYPSSDSDLYFNFDVSPSTFVLNDHEIELINAYRTKPEMQASIDKLLDIAPGDALGADMAETVLNAANHPIGQK